MFSPDRPTKNVTTTAAAEALRMRTSIGAPTVTSAEQASFLEWLASNQSKELGWLLSHVSRLMPNHTVPTETLHLDSQALEASQYLQAFWLTALGTLNAQESRDAFGEPQAHIEGAWVVANTLDSTLRLATEQAKDAAQKTEQQLAWYQDLLRKITLAISEHILKLELELSTRQGIHQQIYAQKPTLHLETAQRAEQQTHTLDVRNHSTSHKVTELRAVLDHLLAEQSRVGSILSGVNIEASRQVTPPAISLGQA